MNSETRVSAHQLRAPTPHARQTMAYRTPRAAVTAAYLLALHVPAGAGYEVSFEEAAQAARHDGGAETLAGLRLADGGLWVAATIGSYTHVRLTAQSVALLYPLAVV
jgi:hypothetical protein